MNNIKAEIVADSLSPQGDRLISVLATFPRIILAEVNTHRMLSKNTSSSRAIPFNKMVEAIQSNPFIPIAWQKDHKGMQGSEYLDTLNSYIAKEHWLKARDNAILEATLMNRYQVTKQLCNRLLEPFMWTTVLITGSKEGWDNFFNLRCPSYRVGGKGDIASSTSVYKSKKDAIKDYPNSADEPDINWLFWNEGQAEIHIMDLAEKIYDAFNESTPRQLKVGEWHIPFGDRMEIPAVQQTIQGGGYDPNNPPPDSLLWEKVDQQIVKISTAMAARTSYTVVNDEKEVDYNKMIELHDRLIAQDPPHSSPLEHCARVMTDEEYNNFIKGKFEATHVEPEYADLGDFPDNAKGWCNNLKGFIPYRYMVDNKYD